MIQLSRIYCWHFVEGFHSVQIKSHVTGMELSCFKQMVMCGLTKVLWTLRVKNLQLLHLLLLHHLLFVSAILLRFGWWGGWRNGGDGNNIQRWTEEKGGLLKITFYWLVQLDVGRKNARQKDRSRISRFCNRDPSGYEGWMEGLCDGYKNWQT